MALVNEDYAKELDERKDDADEEKPEKPKSQFLFEMCGERFKDVIGMHREKKYLQKYVQLPLLKIDKALEYGIGLGGGILFYGPPGTGKTLLARAAAGEFGLIESELKISDVLRKWVGESEENIAKYFKEAYANQPCMLFIDELDGLGADSGGDGSGQSTVDKNVKIELQTEISRLTNDKTRRIFVIGATNKPWRIASEMKRSGRFDYILYVRSPGFLDRMQVFRHYLEKDMPHPEKHIGNINYFMLAMATPYYSPADIEKICRVAKITAFMERDKTVIRTGDLRFVLKNKEHARSSLDEWYFMVKKEYIGEQKYKTVATQGRQKTKQLVGKEGSLGAGERKLYKDLIRDVEKYVWWYRVMVLQRWVCARLAFDSLEIKLPHVGKAGGPQPQGVGGVDASLKPPAPKIDGNPKFVADKQAMPKAEETATIQGYHKIDVDVIAWLQKTKNRIGEELGFLPEQEQPAQETQERT